MWFPTVIVVSSSCCRFVVHEEKEERSEILLKMIQEISIWIFNFFLCVHVLFSSLRLAYAHCANICSTISLSFIPFTGPKDSSVSLFFSVDEVNSRRRDRMNKKLFFILFITSAGVFSRIFQTSKRIRKLFGATEVTQFCTEHIILFQGAQHGFLLPT